LPYPEYQSFLPNSFGTGAKLFHFIGTFRMRDGYFAACGQRVIAGLRGNFTPKPKFKNEEPYEPRGKLVFARLLTLVSAPKYFGWRALGCRATVSLRQRNGISFDLRPRSSGNNDYGVAYEIFVHRYLLAPVKIPYERVSLIVDLGANVGFSSLYWLSNYPLAKLVAFEPHPKHAAQFRGQIASNGYEARVTFYEAAAAARDGEGWLSDAATASQVTVAESSGFKVHLMDIFARLEGCQIDILKIDIEGGEYELLGDPRFASLDVKAIVLEWHARPEIPDGQKWCRHRLQELGYRLYPVFQRESYGMFWAYRRNDGATADSLRWRNH
jgi:FkbM family methyltransferase